MRNLLLSIAALLALASDGAAAQPARLVAGRAPAIGANPHPAGGFVRGRWRHRGPRSRYGRFHFRRADDFGFGSYGYGFQGFDEGIGAADPHGTGFFGGSGGTVRVEGGRPVYDYDRAYPYEWASRAAGGLSAPSGRYAEPVRCSVEGGIRVCRGRR